MATVIPPDRWPRPAENWEPPFEQIWAVNRETCGAKRVMLGRSVVPPSARNHYHYHHAAQPIGYVVQGSFRNFNAGDVIDLFAGGFWHIVADEPHWSQNLSDSEICLSVTSFVNAATLKETETVFLDPATSPVPPREGTLPGPGRYGEPSRGRILNRAEMTSETDPETGITTTWGISRDNSNVTGGLSFVQTIPAGRSTPLAATDNAEAAIFVIRGALVVESGDPLVREEAPAESFVYVPAGEAYRLINPGEAPAEIVCVLAGTGVSHREDLRIARIDAVRRCAASG